MANPGGSAAASVLGLWVFLIPPGYGCLSLERVVCCQVEDSATESITSLEESFRALCCWVWSWSLDSEEALAHQGSSRHKKYLCCATISKRTFPKKDAVVLSHNKIIQSLDRLSGPFMNCRPVNSCNGVVSFFFFLPNSPPALIIGNNFWSGSGRKREKDTRSCGGKINLNWAACYRSRRRPEACGRSLQLTSIAC